MAFLDNTGLSYLYGKIKALFGASLTVNGSTLTLKSKSGADLSSVTLPAYEPIGLHRYGALWDANSNTCKRMYNAVGMTANAHKGSFDPDLVNDFDNIYPWSGRCLCNWTAGTADEKAKITAFEGEPGYDPDDNLGAYTPAFWYKIEVQEGGGILFVIADGKLPGYTYNPPYMVTTCFVGNDGNNGFTGRKGDVQMFSKSLNSYISYAAAQGMIVEDYWCDGAEKLLQIVEFAAVNSQDSTGRGCVNCRRNAADVALIDETNVNHITVTADVAARFETHINHIAIGIGTTLDGAEIACQRRLTAIEIDETDNTRARMIFDGAPVNISAGNIVQSMGAINDGAPCGSASGYIGTEGVNISYYRGAAVQHGAYSWIANIERDSNEHIYVASTDTPQAGAIGDDWVDTGIVLPYTNGYIESLGVGNGCPIVLQPTAIGGTSSDPVGDYVTRSGTIGASETGLLARGYFGNIQNAGIFCSRWTNAPASAPWNGAARAVIRDPFGTGGKVETPVKSD